MNPTLNSKDMQKLALRLRKYSGLAMEHAVFVAVLVVLVAYSFMVWRINQLADAEPSIDAENAAFAKTRIPKIDKDAIDNIQTLEQSSSRVHSLFEGARNNPFQE